MAEYVERGGAWFDPASWECVADACKAIKEAPAADVVPVRHGRWTDVYQDGACSWSGRCSACRTRNDIPHPLVANFCPACGARMDL